MMMIWYAFARWLAEKNDEWRGMRTVIIGAVIAAVGAINALDIVPLLPEPMQKWGIAFLPSVFIFMRFITSGPVQLPRKTEMNRVDNPGAFGPRDE